MADWEMQPEALLAPEACLILTALLLLLFSRWDSRKEGFNGRINLIALVGLGLSLGWLLLFLARGVIDQWLTIPTGVDYYDHHLRVDIFSQLVKAAFVGTALLVALASRNTMATSKNMVEFHFLLISATLGMFFVASALDLLTLFVGLELASLSSYALVAHRKDDDAATEAGAKYFLIGAFSSALALYGISLVYGAANTLNLEELRTAIAQLDAGWSDTLFVATLFILAGFSFKVAAVPFHAWAPDVYQGAPTPVTAFLAAASKIVGFVVLFKVFLIALIGVQDDWRIMVAIVAIVTMTVGNLVAISQTSFKRMLAYSSIAQAGYVLIALPVLLAERNATGAIVYDDTAYLVLGAALAHLIIHLFMKGGAFLTLTALSARGYDDDIREMKGMVWRRPWLAFAIALFMFSLAGLPPLAGFWSKFFLFLAAVEAGLQSGDSLLIFLVVVAVLNSALSLFYYLRIVRYMFVPDESARPTGSTISKVRNGSSGNTGTDGSTGTDEDSELSDNDNDYDNDATKTLMPDDGQSIPMVGTLPIAISVLFILGLPIFFGPFLRICQEAAEALLGV